MRDGPLLALLIRRHLDPSLAPRDERNVAAAACAAQGADLPEAVLYRQKPQTAQRRRLRLGFSSLGFRVDWM